MSTTAVPVNDELLALLGAEGQPPERALQEAAVLELYRRATISGGRAAALLGMPKWDFIRWAGELGIPSIRMSPEELREEVEAARAFLSRTATP